MHEHAPISAYDDCRHPKVLEEIVIVCIEAFFVLRSDQGVVAWHLSFSSHPFHVPFLVMVDSSWSVFHGLQWAALEEWTGFFSIGCWVIVFSPQLWANYRRKSGESLSVLFLGIWLVADFFSIVGLCLAQLATYQIVLAAYYTLVDAVLIFQGVWVHWVHFRTEFSCILLEFFMS